MPPQALFLMNHPFVLDCARRLVRRSDVGAEAELPKRVELLYRHVFGRTPSAEELALAEEFPSQSGKTALAWERSAQSLLLTNEMSFVDGTPARARRAIMADTESRVVFNPWDTYVRETDEGPIFISFDVRAAREDLTGTLTSCAQVVIPIKAPGSTGGPVRPENERLWALEEDLCNALAADGVRCRLVGRLTHGGLRVLVFQLDDLSAFRPTFEAWRPRCGDYQVRLKEGEGWDFFDTCLRPDADDWRFMADADVIRNLTKHGSDPNKEHALDFVFLGEPGKLREMAAALEENGFEPHAGADADEGRVVMVRRMTLEIRGVTSLSRDLARMAEDFGVNYDGWGAAIVR